MRGGISIDQSYNLSPDQRQICYDLVKQNIELSKKSGNNII